MSSILNFKNALIQFRDEFMSIKSDSQTIKGMPPVAANLMIAQSLSVRMKGVVEIIESDLTISQNKITELLTEFNDLLENIQIHEKETYQNWLLEAEVLKKRYLMHKNSYVFFDDKKLVSKLNGELFSFMKAVQNLAILKYDLPKDLMVIVERKESMYFLRYKVNEIVELYNGFVNAISEDAPVLLVMDSFYKQIKTHLQPAFEEKNSFLVEKLPKFIENTFNYFKEVYKILSIIKSYEKEISDILELTENLTFFPIDFYDNDVQDFTKTFDKFMARINANTAVITGAMTYIAQYINLIEYTCFDTTLSHHQSMALYYEKYENALFDAFSGMVIKNYNTLKKILDEDRVAFVIRGRLISNNFTFDPDISKIMDGVTAAIDIIANQFKSVPRWKRKTNLRCPEIRNLLTMETYLPHSFYDNIIEKLPVQESRDACLRSFAKFSSVLESQIEKFTKFKFLGEKRHELIISRFTETNPTLEDYKDKIGFFVLLSERMETLKYTDVGCVRLDNTEAVDTLKERCQFWVSTYGKSLVSQCGDNMTTFSEEIAAFEEQLNTDIRDDDGTKLAILSNAAKEIKKTNTDAGIIFRELHDRFHYLVKQNILIPKEQILKFKNVKEKWQNLYIEALAKDLCIEDAKIIVKNRGKK